MKKQPKTKAPKSYWNYRLMAHSFPNRDEIEICMHECHYKNGKPTAYTTEPTTVHGDNVKGIKWVLSKMEEAAEKPVLWYGAKWPAIYKPIRKNGKK